MEVEPGSGNMTRCDLTGERVVYIQYVNYSMDLCWRAKGFWPLLSTVVGGDWVEDGSDTVLAVMVRTFWL